jgi:hypothetical protein
MTTPMRRSLLHVPVFAPPAARHPPRMMNMNRSFRIAIALLLAVVAARISAADGPAPGYKLQEGEDYTFVSPDGQFRVEQYALVSWDGYWHWQFWVFDKTRKHACLLNPKPMDDYSAGFRFSPDGRWLVRMQKTGAGWATLYLYRRDGWRFLEATKKPLGEMAWDYYRSVRAGLQLPDAGGGDDDHLTVDLIKGYDTNYQWLGYQWPEGRYLVTGLFSNKLPHGFWCAYDTATGRFTMPAGLDEKRARAQKK